MPLLAGVRMVLRAISTPPESHRTTDQKIVRRKLTLLYRLPGPPNPHPNRVPETVQKPVCLATKPDKLPNFS
jgi:hypothetical protein